MPCRYFTCFLRFVCSVLWSYRSCSSDRPAKWPHKSDLSWPYRLKLRWLSRFDDHTHSGEEPGGNWSPEMAAPSLKTICRLHLCYPLCHMCPPSFCSFSHAKSSSWFNFVRKWQYGGPSWPQLLPENVLVSISLGTSPIPLWTTCKKMTKETFSTIEFRSRWYQFYQREVWARTGLQLTQLTEHYRRDSRWVRRWWVFIEGRALRF